MWIKHPFFKYLTAIILVLICIFFLNLLEFFKPIRTVIGTLFYPFLIAGFLFYLIRPLVELLSKSKFFPRPVSILTVFAGIAGILYAAYVLLAGTLKKQVNNISQLPDKMKSAAKEAEQKIQENDMGMLSGQSLTHKANQFFGDMIQGILDNITGIFSAVAGAATVLIIVPFVLFFLLKDGHKLIPFIGNRLPKGHQKEGKGLLRDVDRTLAAYIIGQVTVALVDGILSYIGYLIIGLDYALILGIFVTVTAIVPFIGPIIGAIPAIVVALMQDPQMAIYVILTLIIVQQLEGNLVAPVVLGSRLHIHPLTIILLLVVAAPLYGFIGMLIAVPLYSVVKVVIKDLYKFYKVDTGLKA